jgi:arylsulfatase A-like enzyme
MSGSWPGPRRGPDRAVLPARPAPRLLLVVLLPILLAAAGCDRRSGSGPPATPPAPPRNVLLLFIDTLRADRMSLYGHERPTTPHLEEFAATAATFERAFSPASWTRASFASYFTGLYPTTHDCEAREAVLDPALTTLAELFRGRGYRTIGFFANDNIAPGLGFAQGFDLYEHPPEESGYPGEKPITGAAEMNRRVLRWLREERPAEPWFLFLLYVDPHGPYLYHPEHRFGEGESRAVYGARWFLDRIDHAQKMRRMEEIKEEIRLLYDGEIAYADRHIGEVLAALDELGLADDTLIAISSDHGEGLWSHGNYRGHGHQIFQEQVHVPLLVRWPGVTEPGARIARPVAVLDVFGTLARAYGLADPAAHQAGDLLFPAAGPRDDAPIFVTERLDEVQLRAVVEGDWKLIRDDVRDRNLLYHLGRDPGEQESLTDREPERVARLLAMLEAHEDSNRLRRDGTVFEGGVPELSDKEKEGLRALGY